MKFRYMQNWKQRRQSHKQTTSRGATAGSRFRGLCLQRQQGAVPLHPAEELAPDPLNRPLSLENPGSVTDTELHKY